jgi:phage protein D
VGQNVTTDVDVFINGTEIPDTDVISVQCDSDFDQPCMATITLRNDLSQNNATADHSQPVEVKMGPAGGTKKSVFKGEVVGIEPHYNTSGESRIVIRAFNKLHRLSRGKKSKTYQDKSDQDVVSAICGLHGLSANTGSSPKITHKHLYQHGQTDLEFVRVRAARLGFRVWVEDTKLFFDAPKCDQDSGIELGMQKTADDKPFMKLFSARMSSAAVLKKVTVRGWDPKKKEEIVGEESAPASRLGSKKGSDAAGQFGDGATFTVDHPIYSVEEAKAIAKSKLAEANMSYITAEALCVGSADLKLGIVVKIKCNPDQADDRFNGKYLVAGCSQRYTHGTGGGNKGGWETILRLWRDAEKP